MSLASSCRCLSVCLYMMDVLAAGRGSVEAFPKDPSKTYRIYSIPCIQYRVYSTVYTVLCSTTERRHTEREDGKIEFPKYGSSGAYTCFPDPP